MYVHCWYLRAVTRGAQRGRSQGVAVPIPGLCPVQCIVCAGVGSDGAAHVKQHSSWHSSRQSLRSFGISEVPEAVPRQRGTQSLRHERYLGSFLVPSAFSLFVGRIGSLRPLIHRRADASSPSACTGRANDDAASDATNGTACRRVNLTVGGPGCEAEGCRALVGCARAAVCVSTGGGESSAMAYMVAAASMILLRTTDGPGVATVGRRRAERGAPSSRYAYICRKWVVTGDRYTGPQKGWQVKSVKADVSEKKGAGKKKR